MAFTLDDFFIRYSYKDENKQCFNGFDITDVLYLKRQDRLMIKISNDCILPFMAYKDLNDYFNDILNHSFELYFKTKNEDISLSDLTRYIKYYSTLNNDAFRSALPIIENGKICLIYDDIKHYDLDKDEFPLLITYFHNIGYHDEVEFKVNEKKEAVPKEIKVTISNKPVEKKEEPKKVFKRSSKPADYMSLKIDDLHDDMDHVVIVGTIFKVDTVTTKTNKTIQTLYIKDIDNACIAKIFESARFDVDALSKNREGAKAKFYGDYRFDKFSNDHVFFPDVIEFVEDNDDDLVDNEEEKRIELHAHTNKSEMDGVCEAEEIVEAAFNMGHEAVAITDHYVTQAFPRAQKQANACLKKHPERDFKILYGCEFSMVDERLNIVYNKTDDRIQDLEYVVFDLETTGLSSKFDSIIEFGAVLMSRGMIVDRKDFFVKPHTKLSSFISNLTNIKESDLANARTFAECKDEILDFVKGRVLVAHNASFDYGFLNEELKRIGEKPLDNIVIDTLDLARSMFPNRRSYRLGHIAKIYNVEYNEEVAHRADYDAEVLAHVFNLMLKDAKNAHIDTISQLADFQDDKAFYKKIAYHTNVLVKNKQGLKDLFRLVSIAHTKTLAVFSKTGGAEVAAEPRIFRSELNSHRENLLVGSGCLNGEIFELAQTRSQDQLEEAMKFYDYIEVQPLENYRHLVEYRESYDMERLKMVVSNIINTAIKLGKIVVATGDLHFVKKDEKILRDVYINALAIGGAHHPLFIYDKEKRATAIMPDQRFLNTREMLDAFAWLEDEKLIRDLVIYNPKKIADMCEKVNPIHDKLYTPIIEGSDDKMREIVYNRAHELYGDNLDELIEKRLKRELDAIIGNGYGVIYYVSHLLVKKSNEDGYLVGSRGSVGSSLVATMMGITEVNPLPPHYICPKCKHLEWVDDKICASGYNLEDKYCPECNTKMRGDGQDIPFETFLGFNGDKVPDIDLNFSGEYQEKAHLFTREVFGEDHVFRAGTISTVAEKTAFGYVSGYCEENNITNMSKAQRQRLASGCEGVKRTTGQHPGGIIVIPNYMDVYDFTPVQYPANDPNSVWRTTHFDFHEIHDNVLKFDILGHVDPTAMRLLQNISGIDPKSIPMNDPKVMSLFYSSKALDIINPDYDEPTGACGLPEFGTRFVRGILELTRPHTFSELVQISGLSHGTDVWNNNAKDLIEEGIALSEVIGCRDDIMITMLKYDLPPKASFDIMEKVRKGKGLTPEHESLMLEHNVPKWYIESCKKIKYMFPKAHAVAYVIMAVRIAWFKVYHPEYYYVSYFSLRCDAYDISIMTQDASKIKARMDYLYGKMMSKDPNNQASKKEKDLYDTLEICYEMASRGYRLTNIDIEKSLATEFLVNPENNHEIIPPFKVLDGLGDNVAVSIVEARNERPFISKEDLINRTQLSNTLIKKMDEMGILKNLDDTNQISLF